MTKGADRKRTSTLSVLEELAGRLRKRSRRHDVVIYREHPWSPFTAAERAGALDRTRGVSLAELGELLVDHLVENDMVRRRDEAWDGFGDWHANQYGLTMLAPCRHNHDRSVSRSGSFCLWGECPDVTEHPEREYL